MYPRNIFPTDRRAGETRSERKQGARAILGNEGKAPPFLPKGLRIPDKTTSGPRSWAHSRAMLALDSAREACGSGQPRTQADRSNSAAIRAGLLLALRCIWDNASVRPTYQASAARVERSEIRVCCKPKLASSFKPPDHVLKCFPADVSSPFGRASYIGGESNQGCSRPRGALVR